jgi:hypothetical protein
MVLEISPFTTAGADACLVMHADEFRDILRLKKEEIP